MPSVTMMRKTTCVVWLCVLGLLVVQASAASSASSLPSRKLLQEQQSDYNQGLDVCIPGTEEMSVLDRISTDPQFSTFYGIIDTFGLGSLLDSTSNKVTVFAPTNEAWAAAFVDYVSKRELSFDLLDQFGDKYGDDADAKQLMLELVKYHIVPQVLDYDNLVEGEELTTLWDRDTLLVQKKLGRISGDVTWAAVERKNMFVCNGVVNAMDYVLVPNSAVAQFKKIDYDGSRRKLSQACDTCDDDTANAFDADDTELANLVVLETLALADDDLSDYTDGDGDGLSETDRRRS